MKNHYSKAHFCSECQKSMTLSVYEFSMDKFGMPLCYFCHKTAKKVSPKATRHEVLLFKALRKKGIPATLQKNDGKKTIDIAVVEAKVNIEVDGIQHNTSHRQALADLQRTYYSFKKGYLTLRIPNTLVENHLDETAEFVSKFLYESLSQLIEEEEYDEDEFDEDEFDEDD